MKAAVIPAGDVLQPPLYARVFGKYIRVTAVALTDDDANDHMRQHPDEGLLCITAGLRCMAKLADKGTP